MLGVAYEYGDGVPEYKAEAVKWLNFTTAKNHEDAKKVKVLLSKKMTPEQIAEAQKLSTQWFEEKAKEKKK